MYVELLSWKTTSHEEHLDVCLPNGRLQSGLLRKWSSMKITLINTYGVEKAVHFKKLSIRFPGTEFPHN